MGGPEFIQIKSGLFVYSAEFHITMSSVQLSQFEKCISISSSYHPMQKCKNIRHREHDGLLPFFFDNYALRYVYDGILSSADEKPERKMEIKH